MIDFKKMTDNKAYMKRLSKVRKIADTLLEGPRSIMFPEDPKGRKLWLEPVIRMRTHWIPSRESDSLIVYTVPNCLERKPASPVMVRHTKWKTGIDWELCKKEERDWPSIATSHCILSTDQITSVDEMLHKLDESLPSFSFPVEGLDLPGAAGSYIHPENAVIVSEIVNNRLCRITRFCYIELAWIPIESAWTKLDRCWTSLFETLMDIAQVSALPATSVVEKYDTDPAAFAENLRTAAKKEESEE